MRRLVLLAVAVAVVTVVSAIVVFDDDPFGDPPDSFATFQDEAVGFRHPPNWRASGTDVVRLEPPGSAGRAGPVAELRRRELTDEALGQVAAAAERLVVDERDRQATAYDVDVPGSESSSAYDVVFKLRDGTRHRVISVTATAGGRVISLAVRGRVADGLADPRVIAGSLRLDRPPGGRVG